MNVFLSLVLYVAIGGLVCSAVINGAAKECGPQKMENKEFVAIALAWPAYIAAAVFVGDQSLVKTKCGKPMGENS
jgi:hypothetical protein